MSRAFSFMIARDLSFAPEAVVKHPDKGRLREEGPSSQFQVTPTRAGKSPRQELEGADRTVQTFEKQGETNECMLVPSLLPLSYPVPVPVREPW